MNVYPCINLLGTGVLGSRGQHKTQAQGRSGAGADLNEVTAVHD